MDTSLIASFPVEIERVRTSELELYPGNARRGAVDAIVASLRTNGQFAPLIAQRSTGYVLAGNHTLLAARQLRWAEIEVTYLDVDDEQAKKIVLAANRTADLATYDLDALASLLASIDDLDGTGYTDADLVGLLQDDHGEEGLIGKGEGSRVRYGVVIYVADEHEQLELMEQLLEEGRDVRAL